MSKQAPRTIETVARIQVLSDMIQNRIMRNGINQTCITDPDYLPRMQRMLTRSIKINRYGADLIAELGIKQ